MRIAGILFFLVFIIVFLGGSHYYLYWSLIKFFGISNVKLKLGLAGMIGFFAVSFIIASILSRFFEHILVRGYYFLAGFWLGLGLYLLIAFTAAWAVIGVARYAGLEINMLIVAVIAIFAAITFTIYGAYNANDIKIKRLEVSLPGLPEEWRNKTVVQISDVHLGPTNRALFIDMLIDRINELSPQMVFITGDYFDGMDGSLNDLSHPLDRLTAQRGVYYVTGNHETYIGLDRVLSALSKTKIKVLHDEAVTVDGLTVVGVDYSEGDGSRNLGAVLEKIKPARPNILLYHLPRQMEQAAANGIDLMLSGHSHDGQVWPIKYISRLVYGKFVTGLNRLGDLTVYTSTGAGVWGLPLRTGNHPEIVEITLK
jgi:hypothetical protein